MGEPTMNGAQRVVQTLADAGIERLFSLSGNQIMPIYDACIDAGIEIVHTRHEAAAVFMADAWAQLTGQVGIALVTAAPGFANALGALYTARLSESPVVLLSGDAPISGDGTGAFQELAQIEISAPLTKAALRPNSVDELAKFVAQAFRTARAARPGPVHLALPVDLLEGAGDADQWRCSAEEFLPIRADATPDELDALIDALSAAAKPLILTGPALSYTRRGDLLAQLAEAADTPVIPMESPRGLNDPSLGRLAGVLATADTIVSLGKRIDFSVGFGSPERTLADCAWFVVDAETQSREIAATNLGSRLHHNIAADPERVAHALIDGARAGSSRAAWRTSVAAALNERRVDGTLGGSVRTAAQRISSGQLCTAVQDYVSSLEDVTVICDGGEFGQWAQATIAGTRRVINGPSGAIGGALCYALAAKKAHPHACVIALMGDGTVGFHFAEFETAVREGTPFVVVIGNDERWNAEHQIQVRSYGPERTIGCELSGARYDVAVAGLGGHGEYVTSSAQLRPALERAVASQKPACVNVQIEGMPAPTFN